jgi:hypothetical protein
MSAFSLLKPKTFTFRLNGSVNLLMFPFNIVINYASGPDWKIATLNQTSILMASPAHERNIFIA